MILADNLDVADNVILFVVFLDANRSFDQQQQIELMHKKRNLLAQFCKLIIFGVISVQAMANVLQYYTKVSFVVVSRNDLLMVA